MSSPTSVSVKGPSVPRSNSISNGGLVPSKSSILSPTKTKTKIMISKTGHSHTKESSSSSSLSQSQQFRPNNKESNPNIAKKICKIIKQPNKFTEKYNSCILFLYILNNINK